MSEYNHNAGSPGDSRRSGGNGSSGHSGSGSPHSRETDITSTMFGGLIDFAGLFPPAKLDMRPALERFAEHLRSPHSWMLGRFVVPVSRLGEFRKSSVGLLPTLTKDSDLDADQPWLISAVIDGDLEENLDAVFAFNHEHTQPRNGMALIDAIEIKVPVGGSSDASGPNAPQGADFIDACLETMPEEVYPFFEIPIMPMVSSPGLVTTNTPDVRGMVAALAGADAGAKVRTGGVTPEAFPHPELLAEFLTLCAAADVPFKATAGLHHAVRASYPLTYEPGCPKNVMHGFLNLFIAAALVRTHRCDTQVALAVLEETDPTAFRFSDTLVNWREYVLSDAQIAQSRETFALSYGSCSFHEPVDELQRLGILSPPPHAA